MRRRSLLPAALLLFSGLASACAHPGSDPGAVATPDLAPQVTAEADASDEGADDWVADASAPSADPNVITFEDEAGPVDVVAAPPKREEIPGFQLFGTGDSESTPGPTLTLPDDME